MILFMFFPTLKSLDFRPQPWKHLQTVLRNMGYTEDARQIATAFEDHLYAEDLIGQTPDHWPKWRRMPYRHFIRTIHWLFKTLIGYGYRPLRLVMWMLGVWLLCAFIYWSAALHGMMAPSQPLVFQNKQEYSSCMSNWYLCEALPEAYTGFSPLAYSLDLLLPLVNLQQEQDWAPLIPTPKDTWQEEILGNWSFKHLVRLTVWFEILFGWVASLLLVAVVSGLTKRSEDQ